MEEVMKGHTPEELSGWGIKHGGMMLREILESDPRMVSPEVRALAEFAVEAGIALKAAPELLSATKALLEAVNRNHNHEVMGDYCIADAYGLDDEVAEATEAIKKAEAS